MSSVDYLEFHRGHLRRLQARALGAVDAACDEVRRLCAPTEPTEPSDWTERSAWLADRRGRTS